MAFGVLRAFVEIPRNMAFMSDVPFESTIYRESLGFCELLFNFSECFRVFISRHNDMPCNGILK